MKKTISFFILILIAGILNAQTVKTIDVPTAGTLSGLLTPTEKTTITNLKITGNIDARDFKFLLFDTPLLNTLDLSDAIINAYYGTEGSSIDGLSVNANNTMPPFSFYNGGITAKSSLRYITFPNSLVSIGNCAFYWSGLIKVIIPNSVTKIGEMAFNASFDLSSITLGSSVSSIDAGAFRMCSKLKTIINLNPVPPVIGNDCFYDVTPTVLYVPVGTIEAYRTADGWKAFSNYQEYILSTTTKNVSSITLLGATLNGSIDLITNTSVVAHGFCWNTSGSPTLTDNKVNNGSKITEGNYSITISNLTASTKYYVRAYATDGERTVYGNEVSFTTASIPSAAGIISGLQTVCQGQKSVKYTVPAIDYATSYVWSLPAGVTGSSSTNSITVNYDKTFTSGNISVYGRNQWGDGVASSLEITANHLPTTAGTITGNSVVCQGEESVTYSVPEIANATTYVWKLPQGVTGSSSTNTITVNFGKSAVSGNITVNGRNDCGDGLAANHMVTVNELPVIELRDTATVSGGSVPLFPTITYNGAEELTYKWTPSTGLDNDAVAVPLATVTRKSVYTLVVTTSSGCTASASITINMSPMEKPQIGIVGVTNTNKNMIVWNKPVSSGIGSYYIYRETNVGNVYEKIATVPYDSLSVYTDEQSFPDVKSNKYRLSVFDHNDMESALSDPHKTMHLSINKGQNNSWNLIWEPYQGFYVSTYNIYRGTNVGNMSFLGATSGSSTQYTDLTAPTGDVFYQLEVVSSVVINPTKIPYSIQHSNDMEKSGEVSSTSYNSSRSNIAMYTVTAMDNLNGDSKQINIYPNPVKDQLIIDFEGGSTFEILNLTGQVVYSGNLNKNRTIDTSAFDSGIYVVKFKSGKTFEYSKFIRE